MFVNRIDELKVLNSEYTKKNSSFTVVYGRRRVGKTALIREFIKGKPALYFYATEMNLSHQLELFTEQVLQLINKEYLKNISFLSFEQLFVFLSEHVGDEKIVVTIDEYQQLAKLDSSFSSMLQKVWDMSWKSKNIHLILCGSVISMMHSEVLSYSAPLYGRRTSNIHLKPMLFQSISEFISNLSGEDKMNVFASFGTIPKYLEMYDETVSFIENIKMKILDKNAYLYQEVRFLLKEEISDITTYFSILETIAKGNTKLGNIGSRLGVNASYLTRYMHRLIELDIVEKEIPITEKNPEKSKLGRYRIKDKFIAFWFCYVFMNYSFLEIGNLDFVLKKIENSFNERFVSFAFEDYVKEIILQNPEKYLGYIPLKIGRWWSNKEEIDLVAIGEDVISFIECKWQNQKVGFKTYSELRRKAETIQVDMKMKKQFVIFSKAGFMDSVDKSEGKFYLYT